MSVGEHVLAKMPLDPEGHGHLVALRAHDQLILRRTERGEVLGEVRVPLLIELVAFFRDLSTVLETVKIEQIRGVLRATIDLLGRARGSPHGAGGGA